jgi:hypothetical protein
MIIDLLGFTAGSFLICFMIVSMTVYAEGPALKRLAWAGTAALWAGFAGGCASAGLTARSHPFPLMGMFVATPLVIGLAAIASKSGREMLRAVPLPLLIGLNAGRIFAILFLALENAGRLGGPFAFYAGWGDILTGIVAVPLAFAAGRPGLSPRFWILVILWNLFGIADLVNAVFLGVTTSVGSPLEMFHHPPGSAAMQHLPFSLVPSVLVPFYLVIHAAIWARASDQMRAASVGSHGTES